ncbi:MAG: hypothetical protein WAL15_11035, partial [Xanthobacteraceae bacterium]
IERQAFITPGVVIVGASVFGARPPHEDRPGDEFECLVVPLVSKATFAHVRDGEAFVLLGKRHIGRARATAVVRDRKCFGSCQRSGPHGHYLIGSGYLCTAHRRGNRSGARLHQSGPFNRGSS